MIDIQNQVGQVTFTARDRLNDPVSEALGVAKLMPKESTPDMKAILVSEESLQRAMKQMKVYQASRPQLDLPELISAMIDACDADSAIVEKVARRIVGERRRQLDAMAASQRWPCRDQRG